MLDAVVRAIIRPYRSEYSKGDLGMKATSTYTRSDEEVVSKRGMKLQMSYYEMRESSEICVVYCHSSSGCRVEGIALCSVGLQYLNFFAFEGWNVLLFDFSGSGQSEGEFVSLAHYESQDLGCMVEEAVRRRNARVVLWGRSMGAATILQFLAQGSLRECVCAAVLDSPYACLWTMLRNIAASLSHLPGFILLPVLEFARERIKQEMGFDIKALAPEAVIEAIETPLYFVASTEDEFIDKEDIVRLMHKAAAKEKDIIIIQQKHNATRGNEVVRGGIEFVKGVMRRREQKKMKLRVFKKYNREITGKSMAELIVMAEHIKNKRRNTLEKIQKIGDNKEKVRENREKVRENREKVIENKSINMVKKCRLSLTHLKENDINKQNINKSPHTKLKKINSYAIMKRMNEKAYTTPIELEDRSIDDPPLRTRITNNSEIFQAIRQMTIKFR